MHDDRLARIRQRRDSRYWGFSIERAMGDVDELLVEIDRLHDRHDDHNRALDDLSSAYWRWKNRGGFTPPRDVRNFTSGHLIGLGRESKIIDAVERVIDTRTPTPTTP